LRLRLRKTRWTFRPTTIKWCNKTQTVSTILLICVVESKIKALQIEVDELKKRPVVKQVEAPSLDLTTLDKRYACKFPPDNTIVRIEELEKVTKKQGEILHLNQTNDEKNQRQDDEQDEKIRKLEAQLK